MKCNDDDYSHIISITLYVDEFSLDLDRDTYAFMVVAKTILAFSFNTRMVINHKVIRFSKYINQ